MFVRANMRASSRSAVELAREGRGIRAASKALDAVGAEDGEDGEDGGSARMTVDEFVAGVVRVAW